MSKQGSPKDWIEDLEAGLEFRREYGQERDWAKLERLFFNEDETQMENPSPNLIASSGDSLMSSLTVPRPRILLSPRTPDSVDEIPVVETQVNSLFEDTDVGLEFEGATFNAFLYASPGIVKIGYDSEFGYSPQFDLESVDGMTLTQLGKRGQFIEFGRPKVGMPWIASVHPADIVVPWGTPPDIKRARWVAHRIIRHIDEVKQDEKYSNRRDLKPNMSMEDFVRSYRMIPKLKMGGRTLVAASKSLKREYVEMWEIHDRATGRIMVMTKDLDKWLRNEQDALQLDGLPFVSFSLIPRSRTFWGPSQAKYLLAHQEELNDITFHAKKQRRMNLLKWFYNQQLVEEGEIENFFNNVVGAGIGVNGSPRDVVQAASGTSNQDLYQDAEMIRRNAREVVGMSRNQVGEYEQSGRRTATEAMIVEEASDQRLDRRMVQVARAYIQVARTYIKVMRQFWSWPQVVNYMDEEGQQKWVRFVGRELVGDYRFSLSFNAGSFETLQGRVSQANQMASFAMQDPMADQVRARMLLMNAVNDPRFSALYGGMQNAQTGMGMPGMQAQGGASTESQRGGSGGDRMQGVRRENA